MFEQNQLPVQNINTIQGIHITKLMIIETGTYNNQWRRPYNTVMDPSTFNAVAERLDGGNKITPSLMSGIAGQFVMPSAIPERQIEIPNGWGEKRFRFLMEVLYNYYGGAQVLEVILGYTNYLGANMGTMSIDPEMEFFINSVIHIRTIQQMTPMGMQSIVRASDSSHLLADNSFSGAYSPIKDIRMRPYDVYSTMDRSHVQTQGNVFDGRTAMTGVAVKSRRSNTLAANYMSDILQNYLSANTVKNFGQEEEDVFTKAREFSVEEMVSKDKFISAMAQVRGMPPGNIFTSRDLERLDQNVPNVRKVFFIEPNAAHKVHRVGQSQEWGGADRTTLVATILAQAVPAIMAELALTQIAFLVSNWNVGGQPMFTPVNIRGFSAEMDLAPYGDAFQARFMNEVLRDITYNNQVSFSIEMQVDIAFETRMRISIDNQPETEYAVPTFSDALLVPVLTSNDELATSVASDFENLVYQTGALVEAPTNQKIFGKI